MVSTARAADKRGFRVQLQFTILNMPSCNPADEEGDSGEHAA
jgi:hypothetical protein